jgi:type 1 glutamine amidotransferase
MHHYVLAILIVAIGFLSLTSDLPAADKISILLITGQNNHDWQTTSPLLKEILEKTGRFTVDITNEPNKTLADAAALKKYAAFLLDYNGQRWGEPAETNFLEAVKKGTGVAVVHASDNAFPGWVEYEKLVGDLWRKGTGHGKYHTFDIKITDRNHPITKDLSDIKAHPDELYHNLMHMHDAQTRVLASAFSAKESGGTGKDEPMIIVLQYGKGRVFHTPLGHVGKGRPDTKASYDPPFQLIVARGTEWAATGKATIKPQQVGKVAITTTSTSSNQPPNAELAPGWKMLFDGKTTDGWRGFRSKEFPKQGWVIENGCLKHQAGAGGGDIITTGKYQNFELELDWRIAPGGNSGIMYRVSEDAPNTYETGPEMQVLDDNKHPDGRNSKTSAGSVYGLIAPRNKTLRPVGEFNHVRIVAHLNHIQHWLNGVKVAEYDLASDEWKKLVAASKFASMPRFGREPQGHIALQDHGDEVWFCNIKIRELR